jgi:hypothetical protein
MFISVFLCRTVSKGRLEAFAPETAPDPFKISFGIKAYCSNGHGYSYVLPTYQSAGFYLPFQIPPVCQVFRTCEMKCCHMYVTYHAQGCQILIGPNIPKCKKYNK